MQAISALAFIPFERYIGEQTFVYENFEGLQFSSYAST